MEAVGADGWKEGSVPDVGSIGGMLRGLGVVVVLLRRDQLANEEGCGGSPLVSTRLACFAGDLGLRLARTGPDHIHVAAAAGEEDGEEGEEAQAVALAPGSVGATCWRSFCWGGICSQRLVGEGRAHRV